MQYLQRDFSFRKVAYTGYDVPLFVEWMDFNMAADWSQRTETIPTSYGPCAANVDRARHPPTTYFLGAQPRLDIEQGSSALRG
jgi:hypothetical protein